MIHIVLGSQSPRRKEILGSFNLPFTQASSNFNEDSIPFTGNPANFACELSKGKAYALQPLYPKAAILTADTIVYREGKVYGKPANEENAFHTLSTLEGKWHSVFTGVCLLYEKHEYYQVEETTVLFNPLTPEQIRAYLRTSQWCDKAGSYGAQTGGAILIKRIEGCFYNVLGLPINAVRELLQKIGVDLWNYLK